MTEEWRGIPGCDYYEVSDQGRVRSSAPRGPRPNGPKRPRILRHSVSRGYLLVVILEAGRRRTVSVHRLVLQAFAGPCPEGMEARHLNGNREDNRLENLSWGSKKENADDKVRHGTMDITLRALQASQITRKPESRPRGRLHANATTLEGTVRVLKMLASTGQFDDSEIADALGLKDRHVGKIRRGELWRHI